MGSSVDIIPIMLVPFLLLRMDCEVSFCFTSIYFVSFIGKGLFLRCSNLIPFARTGSQNSSSLTGSPLSGKLFIVIGAGGAGKALAYGAKEKGARVVIANRTYGSFQLHIVSILFFSFLSLLLFL